MTRGFPRIACYAGHRGYGWPLTTTNASGAPLDVALIEKLARYPVITLNPSPWYAEREPSRADAHLLLRKINPSIKIGLYVLGTWWYLGPTFVVQSWDKTFNGSQHDAIKSTNGFGAVNGTGWNVKWDNPATEAALTKLWCGAVASGMWDFAFIDFANAHSPAESAALSRVIHALRQAGGPCFPVLANGWTADTLNFDGTFREGFPDLLGNTFDVIRQWRAGRPHATQDWLQAGTGSTSLETDAAKRAARFAHGTACLFDCQCSFGPDRDWKVVPYYGTWWADFYSVTNGMPDPSGAGTGWLGEPMGQISILGVGRIWSRTFAGGVVLVNPNTVPGTTPSLPPGLYAIGGAEMGTVTVPPRDAVFLVRAR